MRPAEFDLLSGGRRFHPRARPPHTSVAAESPAIWRNMLTFPPACLICANDEFPRV